MRNLYILIIGAIICFPVLKIKGQEEKKVIAKIESKDIEGQLKLSAVVSNNSAIFRKLNYLLVSIKKGKSGNLSNNKQSGKFSIDPSETKKLSEIAINMTDKDALKVFLFIRDEETQKLIAKDSLIINDGSFKKKLSRVEESQTFELSGLTIDETKSKVGKDFYDAFYMEYSQMPEKSNYTIIISELPSRGSNGQINIMVEDKLIYSFITNPNEDYQKEQLVMAFKYIKDYNVKRNLIRNEFLY